MVAVWARNAGVTADASQAMAQTTYVISTNGGSPLSVINLTSSVSSPAAPGTSITFTATANGGTAPYQYKWWVHDGTGWVVAREWSTSRTLTWRPTIEGAYMVAVWVRNAGVTADASQAMWQVQYIIAR
jgi:hypothetical protein